MEDILTIPVPKLLIPNVLIGLYCTTSNTIQIVHSTKTGLFLMDKIHTELKNNTYSNREVIQASFNAGTLKFVLFDQTDYNLPEIQDNSMLGNIVLLVKGKQLAEALKEDGYNVIPPHNVPKYKISVQIGTKWYGPQVKLLNAKYKPFFVQKEFTTMKDAREYLATNKDNLFKVLLETKACTVPYGHKSTQPEQEESNEAVYI